MIGNADYPGHSGTWSPPTSDIVYGHDHPGCQRGRYEDNYPHDFEHVQDPRSGQPYIYCRMCGEVRKVETP